MTGTLLAAVIFAIAGPVAISLYRGSLTDSVWGSVTGAASQVAARLESSQQVPDPIPMPVSAGVPRIQVLDARNRVVTGDPASAARPALYRLPIGRSSQRAVVSHPAFLAASGVAVYAVRAATPHGPETVVAAMSLDPAGAQARKVAEFTAALAVGALAVVAAVCWLTAGRPLRPVERLRREAATIAASGDLSGRLDGLGADELARLGGTLNQMLDSLETSVDRQRRFVADAAHEMRTPVAGMTTALEVAQTHPETSQTLVDDLLAGHRRLGRLVNDLLILAAVDGRAPQRADPQRPVDLAGVVTDCSRRPVPDGISLRLGQLDRCSSSATGLSSAGWRATWWIMPCGTPPAWWSCPSARTAGRRWCRCPMTGRGYRRQTASGSGNGSPGSVMTDRGPAAAAASGWPWSGN
jgi:HAMP domain-containing protein